MYELRTSLFGGLLDKLPTCDVCRGQGCEQPFGLTTDGMGTYHPDNDATVVSWPECPRKYEVTREIGPSLVTLAECCRWAVERGVHRNPRVTSGASLLLRDYTRLRDWPDRLSESRAAAESKAKRGGR